MYEFVCVGAYGYVYTIKWHNIVKTSISKQRGSPRKPTGLHGSSRVSKKTTFLLFLPLENAFLRVKNRRKFGIPNFRSELVGSPHS